MNWSLLVNSLIVAGAAAAIAVCFGFVSALGTSVLNRSHQPLFVGGALIALALPPFLVTNSWLDLLGWTGRWRGWLPFDIYSVGGTIWILALMLWPIAFLMTLGSWQRVQRHQLEVDPFLKGAAVIRSTLWPMARPALAQAAALMFILALNNFAVPAVLQTKVYPAEIWVRFNADFNTAGAIGSSWPLLFVPLALVALLARREFVWPALAGGVSPFVLRERLGKRFVFVAVAAACCVLLVSAGLPLGQLVLSRQTWVQLWPAFAAGQRSFWNSFVFAAASAAVAMAVALLCWRKRWGWLFWVFFLAPGVLLGIALIFLFNHSSTRFFYHSAGLVVLALSLRYLAIAWHGAHRIIPASDRDLEDWAHLHGAGRWQLWWDVRRPQVTAPLAAVGYVVYLLCLWDVETLILVVPPGRDTLALRIFNLLHYGHNSQVNALCLLLLGLALLPLALWAARPRIGSLKLLAGFALAALVAGCEPESGTHAKIGSKIFSAVEVIGIRGTGAGQFNKPRSVAVDAHDNLFVVDMTGRVQKFSPDGSFISLWQMPQTDKGRPKGMCRDGQGNIVVIEPHYARVNHFSPDGKLVAQWGTEGTNAGQLKFPRAAAVNSRGELFVSEYGIVERVQKFTPLGRQFLGSIGRAGTGPGEFNRAEGVEIDSHDRLYVADSCNHRIQIFSAEGRFLRAYGRPGQGPGELSYPYDIRVDQSGNQVVCEFGNSRLQIFDERDRLIEVLGKPGSELGEFNNPWSIAFDSAGNLYVADSGNNRVQKFIRRNAHAANALSAAKLQGPLCLASPRTRAPHPNPLPARFEKWNGTRGEREGRGAVKNQL